jgi:hypothetical protein
MEVIREKKSIWMSLDISPLFFCIVSKLVQAFDATHDQIFQALAVEGGILLPKPFLDPTPSTIEPRLIFFGVHVFGKLKNYLQGQRFPSYNTVIAKVRKWLMESRYMNVSL